MDEAGVFTEKKAAKIIFKIIEGLNHIHNVNVVHRDLKPENIIIDDNDSPKIIDFGLSTDTLNNTKKLKTYVGSKLYMAPEIIDNVGHTSTCDMWSIGIILYLMLSGGFPFSLRNVEYEIANSPVVFPEFKWGKISLLCKHFILKLLDKNSHSRMQPEEALKHPWFNILNSNIDHLSPNRQNSVQSPISPGKKNLIDYDLLLKLQKFRGVSKLRMAAVNILIKTM